MKTSLIRHAENEYVDHYNTLFRHAGEEIAILTHDGLIRQRM